jgi:hypothetical protein
MSKKRKEKIDIEIEYFDSENSNPIKKIFTGGIVLPKLIDFDIEVNSYEYPEYNENDIEPKIFEKQSITILGSKKTLFELGKFIIGISKFETKEPNYHEHIELERSDDENFIKELTIQRLDDSIIN